MPQNKHQTSWEPFPGVPGAWVADSHRPGPTVSILTGVHGNEEGPIKLFDERQEFIKPERGKAIVILGNPKAVQEHKRTTEGNLNRWFKQLPAVELPLDLPYEARRAQELLPVLRQSDALLDLHEFSQKDGEPFVITEPRGFGTAAKIGSERISSGWSHVDPGGSDSYMESLGREGLAYEIGTIGEDNDELGREVVRRFLSAEGLTSEKLPPIHQNPIFVKAMVAYMKRSPDFRFVRDFESFEELTPGEFIAQDGESKGQKHFLRAGDAGGVIIFPHADTEVGTEAFYIGRVVNLAKQKPVLAEIVRRALSTLGEEQYLTVAS